VASQNCAQHLLHVNRAQQLTDTFDEQANTDVTESQNPETLLLQKTDGQLLNQALEELPIAFREVFVLLEIEGLSYKGIAEVLGIPIGTVMSRLARARTRLRDSLSHDLSNGNTRERESTNRAHRPDLQTGQGSQSIGEEFSESVTNEDADV
jgi:DNA-directed RNA polymerase specialized sigma24 family protein